MSTGQKLQAAAAKVNAKLGMQDGPIIFRLITIGERAHVAAAPTVTNDDLTISTGIKLSYVEDRHVQVPGQMEAGDLRLEIPGNLIEESRIKNPKLEIVYKNDRWSPYRALPTKFISGVPVKWLVLAKMVK